MEQTAQDNQPPRLAPTGDGQGHATTDPTAGASPLSWDKVNAPTPATDATPQEKPAWASWAASDSGIAPVAVAPAAASAGSMTPVYDVEDEPVAPDEDTLEMDAAQFVSRLAERIATEVHKAIKGQEEVVEAALVALLAGGHILFEGVPGTAKTLLVRSLSAACSTDFKRIQFTPDLMPSDISGTSVFDMTTSTFNLRRGPIFGEFILADEINRTPPKTQAALLEAMEERRVSIDGTPNPLPPVFTVFATQNPVEYEGTYPLPEAQLDRFLMKVIVPYPSEEAEADMLRAFDRGFKAANLATAHIEPVASADDLLRARASLTGVKVEPKIINYVLAIVRRTREHRQLTLGASPRATVALLQASKTLALIRGRDYVIPDDVKEMTLPVLRHRILLRPEAEIEGAGTDRILKSLVEGVEVPR